MRSKNPSIRFDVGKVSRSQWLGRARDINVQLWCTQQNQPQQQQKDTFNAIRIEEREPLFIYFQIALCLVRFILCIVVDVKLIPSSCFASFRFFAHPFLSVSRHAVSHTHKIAYSRHIVCMTLIQSRSLRDQSANALDSFFIYRVL